MLGLGITREGLDTLRQALKAATPRDKRWSDMWRLLETAPSPPPGLADALAMLREAEAHRAPKAETGNG